MKRATQRSSVQLTKEGLGALKAELSGLKDKKLPEVLDRIAKAREDGDLSENSAYIFGKQEQEFIEGRIAELGGIIQNASIIRSSSQRNTVDVGCKVTVGVNGQKHAFTVVGDWEANPAEKKISGSSPLGKALIGKMVGEKVDVEAPAGKVVYTVLHIE